MKCGKWFHSTCAGAKRLTPKLSRNVAFLNECEGNIGEGVEQEEKLCDDEETHILVTG